MVYYCTNKCKYPWLMSNLMHKILIYLHIIHLLKSSTCFEHYPAHLQDVYVVTVYMQPLVSSLSAGDCPVHRLRYGAQDSHLHRVTIPEVAYIQLRRRRPEDEQDNARNMQRILINVFYVNNYKFCALSSKSTTVIYYDARSSNHEEMHIYIHICIS